MSKTKSIVFPLNRRYPSPQPAGNINNHTCALRSSGIVRAFAEKPGKVFLLYGERAIFQLSLQMAAQSMAGGKPIAVVDGCNRFDVHALSRFARARKIDPNKFLGRIFISRGFTCYRWNRQLHTNCRHFSETFIPILH
jgi:hypothetical protein